MRYIIKILVTLLLFVSVLPAAAQDAPCTVSTPKTNSVRIRETPDRNGKIAGYMAPNTQFNVTGRFQDNRKGIWFRLINQEVMPTTTAPELWVGAVAVTAAGNCDAVALLNPAPAQTTTTTTNTTAPAAGPLLPLAGRWNATLDSMVTFSCVDQGAVTFSLDDTDFGSERTFRTRITRSGDGFAMDGFNFTPTGDGKWTGGALTFNDISGGNSLFLLTVDAEKHMFGTVIVNAVFDGVQCSVNVNVNFDWVRR